MKNKIKFNCLWLAGIMLMCIISSCSLDYENTAAINPDNVWSDKKMINSFLTDIHGGSMPGAWPVNGNNADEAFNSPGSMGNYQRGIISVESNGQRFTYGNIDKINFFLDKLPGVASSVLTDQEKNQMAGQALFWRAWAYWGMVANIGGMPLILKPQDVTNVQSLFLPRNKTSECITQIIQDLDDAIANLPDVWTGADYGRIDKGAAMAFKGRVLLWYASPLFNPSNDQSRWNNAYQANKDAVDFLRSQGKGLYADFGGIWIQKRNQEVVMVNQYYYPDHVWNNNSIRPQPITKDMANQNQPFVPLLLAFPKKDGSPLRLDVTRLASDPAYNASFFTDFYTNRDPRFYATLFCPGTVYPTPDFTGGDRYWNAWKKELDPSSPLGYKYTSLIMDQMGVNVGSGISGYFQLKGLDRTLTMANVPYGTTDWIEIRFAEVLMNYGECANETGKTSEALQALYDVRKRANIEAGSGNYGITAVTQAEIREAYINERFIEFALENKRSGDLRRWKRYDIPNAIGYRSGLYPVLNDGVPVSILKWTDDMNDPEVRKKFHLVYIENLDGDPQYKFNFNLNHWFYPIAQNDLDRNSKLEQNNEWGGTFDPLQ